MKHETTWLPDTCDCKIVYEWNDGSSDTSIVSVSPCSRHSKLGLDIESLFTHIKNENKTKNDVLNELITDIDSMQEKVDWSFDDVGDMTVTVDADVNIDNAKISGITKYDRNITIVTKKI